jgi:hypothetical protein
VLAFFPAEEEAEPFHIGAEVGCVVAGLPSNWAKEASALLSVVSHSSMN